MAVQAVDILGKSKMPSHSQRNSTKKDHYQKLERCLEQIYIAKNGELVEKDVKAIRSTLHFWKYRNVCIQQEIHFSKKTLISCSKPYREGWEEIEVYVYIIWNEHLHSMKKRNGIFRMRALWGR